MASNVPIIRQVAWISLIPQLIFMALLMLFYYWLGLRESIIWGAVTYLVLSFALRKLIPKDHNRGMKLIKELKFKEAITAFEKSVDFFTRNKWIDKYRFIVMLSSSKMAYREMDLCNIAFCYGQLGDGLKAKECYELVLREYPGNGIAQTSLNLLNSI